MGASVVVVVRKVDSPENDPDSSSVLVVPEVEVVVIDMAKA